jgi:hypothetical protein
MINAAVDYDSRFPAVCQAGHTAGLRPLRVAARVRAEHPRHCRPAMPGSHPGRSASSAASSWTGGSSSGARQHPAACSRT